MTSKIAQLDRIPAVVRSLMCHLRALMRVFACAPTLVTQCGGPTTMAKALLGHVGGPDPRMLSEMRRLQQRVQDLEAELARLQGANDVLAAGVSHDFAATDREPALT